ncbi:MAG TPA: TetR/AcrR family transcriptional regulator [Ilumatobacteraceae bacterium]|nr:TetR/AcrR family transcriptional regulator [Ilumatobacteraceae bacterium]
MTAIKTEARRQLAEVGAPALSLRSIARELGMVSSAVYRYVSSRDELLTLLIVDAYDSIGAAAEHAAGSSRTRSPAKRWLTVCRAVRTWALAHPHEYALVYGSPVPGYAAPVDTISPAIRVSAALIGVIADAHAAGHVGRGGELGRIPRQVRRDADAIAAALGTDLPDEVVIRALIAWTQLFGLISFELFGQTRNGITDHDALFTVTTTATATLLGLTTE